MKLSDYAKQMGVRYETAWRWFRDGRIQGWRVGPHTISVTEDQEEPARDSHQRVALFAQVSPAENKSNLDSQSERLVDYRTTQGYQVAKVVKEVVSGIIAARPMLRALLIDQRGGMVAVEHKDHLTRFAFRFLNTLLMAQGHANEVVSYAENGTED